MSTALPIEDQIGLNALDTIGEQDAFNQWMYETIAPYCQGQILEIGSGIGNISRFFLEKKAALTLSDLRPEYLQRLKKRFKGQLSPSQVQEIDLVASDFKKRYTTLFNQFDSVFALNVLEHIADQDLALRNAALFLKPGGRILILVPAYFQLYNQFDQHLGHYRRYTRSSLERALRQADLVVNKSFHFNLAGIPGWWLSGKIQGNREIPKGQMHLFNQCVPLFKWLDKGVFTRIGLSTIGIAQKSKEKP